MLSHDHITPDTHATVDYQKLLGAKRSQPEFNENPDTPMWRIGAFIGNENLDFRVSDNYDITSYIASSFQGRMMFVARKLTEEPYPEYPDLQMSYYPQSEYVATAGVGHTGLWEKSDEVATVIRNFLNP